MCVKNHRFCTTLQKKRNKTRPCTRREPRTSPSIKAFFKFWQNESAARKRRRADFENGHILTRTLYHKNDIKSIDKEEKLSPLNEQKRQDDT